MIAKIAISCASSNYLTCCGGWCQRPHVLPNAGAPLSPQDPSAQPSRQRHARPSCRIALRQPPVHDLDPGSRPPLHPRRRARRKPDRCRRTRCLRPSPGSRASVLGHHGVTRAAVGHMCAKLLGMPATMKRNCKNASVSPARLQDNNRGAEASAPRALWRADTAAPAPSSARLVRFGAPSRTAPATAVRLRDSNRCAERSARLMRCASPSTPRRWRCALLPGAGRVPTHLRGRPDFADVRGSAPAAPRSADCGSAAAGNGSCAGRAPARRHGPCQPPPPVLRPLW